MSCCQTTLIVSLVLHLLPQVAFGKQVEFSRPTIHVAGEREANVEYHSKLQLITRKEQTMLMFFDLCEVIHYEGYNSSYRGTDIYLCFDQTVQTRCAQNLPYSHTWCQTWGQTTHFTGSWTPEKMVDKGIKGQKNHNAIMDRIKFQINYDSTQNPIMLSINGQVIGKTQHSYLVIGADVSGRDPRGLIYIIVFEEEQTANNQSSSKAVANPPVIQILNNPPSIVEIFNTEKITSSQILALVTRYTQQNLWIAYLQETARLGNFGDCIMCAAARPTLYSAPGPIMDIDSLNCNIEIYKINHNVISRCAKYENMWPKLPKSTVPLMAHYAEGNYTCLKHDRINQNKTEYLGVFPFCHNIIDVTTWGAARWPTG
ncbi:uncharacterized protein LOC133477371 [Phyllopteryx taeniolatus]|uniref:uncharacterized protein LOC133477371 n=1 Tax=Phyllopteryx taeniolatus TaxID=161469 RepID=UPI002AD54DAA|nr:uncharacterized protein LOC133477371 [Phyllopteryx taeniolatus]XP_061627980.1 uncharacterized protein LOC133477371 [Phyllopteryx taeniolatus]XP_061627981.1 uncharacterized protein LOC133477371 [Phyllopteryx taeniolatus]XP_061627982.1 uncharacterized protein LOC133477371 [Phyllopteryx taeniolatus]XP_061627983.1 uncharacterized protein LOC133477371 [Phyllopteryx taeniolatus]XP_061627984.1 uncharacterized protein LOC133477371 [Phyllopteryx taeniolatus]XP_061627985.1 uncharacterized protein LO